jgi:hypothetical protein
MGWFENIKKAKDPEKRVAAAYRTIIPVCKKCETEIENLDVSIGDTIECMGACLYSGSEGHLYEPMYNGVICTSCSYMLCDNCQSDLTDESRCPQCGGTLRQIVKRRLPRIG